MIYNYPHAEAFVDWEKPDFKQFSGNLILWGAGRIGGVAAHCLKQQGVDFLAFCDIAKDKWGTIFCNHKVISPEELNEKYNNAAVVITNVFHSSVYSILLKSGFTQIFDCAALFMQINFENYDFWMEPDYAVRNVEQYLAAVLAQKGNDGSIDQVFLNITTKCSLRCKCCSLFIPYVTSPCNYRAQDIMADFIKILDCLKHVRIVNFYGGEPLLHPELPAMIRSLNYEKRVERISIITNGTILPSSELIAAMREEERFLVRISDYGVLSDKLEDIKNILEKNHIRYEIANYSYWDEPSKINYFDSADDELAAKFKHCTACNVLFLHNRKAYLCSTASAVCNMEDFPHSESNYVELENREENFDTFRKKIMDFVSRPKNGRYIDACSYCSGNHCTQFEHKIPVAEQTKEHLVLKNLNRGE